MRAQGKDFIIQKVFQIGLKAKPILAL